MIERAYQVATLLVLGGFGLLCQPFSELLFNAGFPVLLVGVVLHIVLDHWPRRRRQARDLVPAEQTATRNEGTEP